jgi:hypothetical protein
MPTAAEFLRRARKQSSYDPIEEAGQVEAPLAQMPGLSQAYSQPMPGIQGQTPPPNPFMPQPGLEQMAQAQGMQQPMHPLIQQIMQRFGLLNFLRNRANQQIVDPMSQ